MAQIAQHHVEILRRIRDGKHLGGGRISLATLQDEVDRLVALRLIEPAGGVGRYRLTAVGAVVLSATTDKPDAPRSARPESDSEFCP